MVTSHSRGSYSYFQTDLESHTKETSIITWSASESPKQDNWDRIQKLQTRNWNCKAASTMRHFCNLDPQTEEFGILIAKCATLTQPHQQACRCILEPPL